MADLRTVLDEPTSELSGYERALVEQVREHGWRSTGVAAEAGVSPSFTYSTGFWLTLNYPEVLIFDFPTNLAHDVLGTMARKIQTGSSFPTDQPVTGILANEPVVLTPIKAEAVPDYLVSTHWFYKRAAVSCLQLVWPDRDGRFPWENGFDPKLLPLQPDLSERGWERGLS